MPVHTLTFLGLLVAKLIVKVCQDTVESVAPGVAANVKIF